MAFYANEDLKIPRNFGTGGSYNKYIKDPPGGPGSNRIRTRERSRERPRGGFGGPPRGLPRHGRGPGLPQPPKGFDFGYGYNPTRIVTKKPDDISRRAWNKLKGKKNHTIVRTEEGKYVRSKELTMIQNQSRFKRNQICKYWKEGSCRQGPTCPYAHGDETMAQFTKDGKSIRNYIPPAIDIKKEDTLHIIRSPCDDYDADRSALTYSDIGILTSVKRDDSRERERVRHKGSRKSRRRSTSRSRSRGRRSRSRNRDRERRRSRSRDRDRGPPRERRRSNSRDRERGRDRGPPRERERDRGRDREREPRDKRDRGPPRDNDRGPPRDNDRGPPRDNDRAPPRDRDNNRGPPRGRGRDRDHRRD